MSSASRPPGVRRLLRLTLGQRTIRAEIDDEIRFHIASRVDDLIAAGMDPAASRERAEREYGDLAASRRELVSVGRRRLGQQRREEILMSFAQDLSYAARGLARRPALLAVTTFALTVGIAANAIMFGVLDQLLLRPPAGYAEPESLTRVYFRQHDSSGEVYASPVTTYRAIAALREHVAGFSGVAAFYRSAFTLGHGAEARRVDVELVSGNYFDIARVRAQRGRTFAPGEDVPPLGAQVVVLSDGFWRSHFAAEEDAIGRTLELNGKTYTVVGVAPPNLGDLDRENVDIWIPISAAAADLMGDDWYRLPNSWWVQGLARVRPGVDPSVVAVQATAAYRGEVASWNDRSADSTATVILGSLVGGRKPDGVTPIGKVTLWLMGVSAIVLLIACANVANLLVARTLDRRREIAVRLALGVSRGRLLRQLLTEAALLAAIAAAAALLVAHWGSQFVQRVLLPGIVFGDGVLAARVLAFTLAIAVACIVLAGLAPALQGARADVADGLKASARQVAGGRGRLRAALLVTQAALSLLLLVGAGLFVKSLRRVVGRDVGITLDRVLLVSMDLNRVGFDRPRIDETYARGAERIRALPGVEHVSVAAATVPMRTAMAIALKVPGLTERPKLDGGGPYYAAVDDDFFATTGARIATGRAFTPAEERTPSRVLLVNQLVADAYWPGRSPIGDCVRLGNDSTCSTVIGIVQNIMMFSIVRDDRAMIYLPRSHPSFGNRPPAGILVRTAGDPDAIAPLVQRELQRLSPNMPFVEVKSYLDILAPQLRPWRLGATMFTLFGVIALVIAAVGLYSVMAYWVAQRRHEIGVRLALGARRGDVVRLVAVQAFRPIAVGLLLGAAGAALSARWVADLLYDTSPHDPWVYGGAALALTLAAAAASVVPARRSAGVDPATALRAD